MASKSEKSVATAQAGSRISPPKGRSSVPRPPLVLVPMVLAVQLAFVHRCPNASQWTWPDPDAVAVRTADRGLNISPSELGEAGGFSSFRAQLAGERSAPRWLSSITHKARQAR